MPDINDAPDLEATVPVAGPTPSNGSSPRLTVNLPLPEDLAKLLPEGTYTVEGFLGQGGMGAVYRGTQVRLQRQVAIKIMCRDQGRDHGFEERFRREALALAQLNHPNIVNVIDYGEAGPDYLYIVMEFVDGTDLVGVIRSGQMTQETALKLLPQICDALQFAHDNGIVHRDIKPANILLTRDGRIKMADFGLAKRFDVNSTFQTQTGAGMGTPDYAAPEQFDPNGNVDHRADIYALGVMIYQMVTGQLPRGAWKPPSEKADVDSHWDKIVSHALQTDPSDRYASVTEIKTDISSIMIGAGGPRLVQDGTQASHSAGFNISKGSTTALTQAGGRPASKAQPLATQSDVPQTKNSRSRVLIATTVLAALLLGGWFGWKNLKTAPAEAPSSNAPLSFSSDDRAWAPPTPTVTVGTEWTNLISHIKPERDVIRGGWAVDEKGLTAKRAEWAICNLPVKDPGTDYDLRYKVTRGEGSHLAMFFAFRKGSTGGYVPIDYIYDKAPEFADGQRWATIEDLTHLEMRDVATIKAKRKEWLPRGKACTVLLQVRDKQVIVSVDDEEAFRWPAEWSKLQQRGGAGGSMFLDVTGGPIFGVGIFNCEAVFHSIEMRRVGSAQTPASVATPANATKDTPFENTLGMKFVPVPISGGPTHGKRVLFSVWETRVQDYERFVKETNREWTKPPFAQAPDHSAVNMSWDDATAFCTWLTERERKAGKLGASEGYCLPADHEWSYAVGIGLQEDAAKSPAQKDRALAGIYPWGTVWPPPANAGNYAGEEMLSAKMPGRHPHASPCLGYRDAYVETAPAASFPANELGLYDLGGSIWEWCEDWYDDSKSEHVLRGGAYIAGDQDKLLTSARNPYRPTAALSMYFGFRCVLVIDEGK
jgi:serine/threonine protein kinase